MDEAAISSFEGRGGVDASGVDDGHRKGSEQ